MLLFVGVAAYPVRKVEGSHKQDFCNPDLSTVYMPWRKEGFLLLGESRRLPEVLTSELSLKDKISVSYK